MALLTAVCVVGLAAILVGLSLGERARKLQDTVGRVEAPESIARSSTGDRWVGIEGSVSRPEASDHVARADPDRSTTS